jgi:hypothetical protein
VTVADETINSTSRHPYFVVRGEGLDSRPTLEHLARVPEGATTPGRWVDAVDLRVGDELLLLDGRVERIEHIELYPFFDTVYNFEVDDLHCYAVGRSGILVHNNNGPEGVKVYRGGSATPDNLTPRPGIDTTGLSTFDNLEAATPPGGKAQVIDTSKLKPPLVATPDAPPAGHVSIAPQDPALIAEWAATRGTGQIHPLTQAIMDAVIEVVKRPK